MVAVKRVMVTASKGKKHRNLSAPVTNVSAKPAFAKARQLTVTRSAKTYLLRMCFGSRSNRTSDSRNTGLPVFNRLARSRKLLPS